MFQEAVFSYSYCLASLLKGHAPIDPAQGHDTVPTAQQEETTAHSDPDSIPQEHNSMHVYKQGHLAHAHLHTWGFGPQGAACTPYAHLASQLLLSTHTLPLLFWETLERDGV